MANDVFSSADGGRGEVGVVFFLPISHSPGVTSEEGVFSPTPHPSETLFFLNGVVVAVVFLVRSLMRLQRESTGPYLGLKLLLAVISWIALTMAVFVLEIYLFDWLYWRI